MKNSKKLPNIQIGDNGMGFDESQEQEDYSTYSTYLSFIQEGNMSVEKAMELLSITKEQLEKFVEIFEPTEEELNS